MILWQYLIQSGYKVWRKLHEMRITLPYWNILKVWLSDFEFGNQTLNLTSKLKSSILNPLLTLTVSIVMFLVCSSVECSFECIFINICVMHILLSFWTHSFHSTFLRWSTGLQNIACNLWCKSEAAQYLKRKS